MKTLLAFILISTNLSSQSEYFDLVKETGYSIRNLDTLIAYETEYDSNNRKTKITHYPCYRTLTDISILKFDYRGDTIIELKTTEFLDTLKKTTYIIKNGQKLGTENIRYGDWISGKYSKLKSKNIQKWKYNDSNEVIESINYSENLGSVSNREYNRQIDTSYSNLISIHYETDSYGNQLKKELTQNGLSYHKVIRCDLDCTKMYVLESSINKLSPISSIFRVTIKNGDTTSVSKYIKTNHLKNYHTKYYEYIMYDGSPSHYDMDYYFENNLYLTESFLWKNNKWVISATEEVDWNEDKLRKTIRRTTFKEGQKINEFSSFVIYHYVEPMHNKRSYVKP